MQSGLLKLKGASSRLEKKSLEQETVKKDRFHSCKYLVIIYSSLHSS